MGLSQFDIETLMNRAAKQPKKNKFGAVKKTVDGIKFHSSGEARRYTELKIQENLGLISNLRLQVPFILIDTFKHKNKTIRGVTYYADFVYIRDGIEYVEDFKGHRTQEYKLKKKMLLSRYPEINFIETK